MFIVKIDVPGWEHYEGLLGMVPFKNGISERPLTQIEMDRIGASIRLVKVDSDEQVGASVAMANSRNVSAEVKAPLQVAQPEPEPVELEWDRERLEVLASEGGIKSVREVAKLYGVKGVEISKMIDEIIEAQLPKKDK